MRMSFLRGRATTSSPPPASMASLLLSLASSLSFSSVGRSLIDSSLSLRLRCVATTSSSCSGSGRVVKKKKKKKDKEKAANTSSKVAAKAEAVSKSKAKTRTRSPKDYQLLLKEDDAPPRPHVPVMLGEVLDVFSSKTPFRSFVDCTLGAAGHSSAIIRSHPQLQVFIGIDVDSVAHDQTRAHIHSLLHSHSQLKPHTFLNNFKHIKSVLAQVDPSLSHSAIDGILMDLGMSSMQVNNPERGFSLLGNGPLDMRMDPRASLKAEDILNSWPDDELGRVLREYGEESNWYFLQNKIVQARLHGGLHTTSELVDLIRSTTSGTRGGRKGWIKTATRVFQALRIAVNDELKTLEDSLYACFDCLAPGGRLAVISFHSLEDRIVKQTFLNIINCYSEDGGDESEEMVHRRDMRSMRYDCDEKETWIRQMVHGKYGTILTKRPITPSEEEERLNRRSRSAKLRVIQKVLRR